MKRIRREKSVSTKRVVRFTRKVSALVLASTMLIGGGMTVNATTLVDVFDAEGYADRYVDLKEAFGYDAEALLQHYLTYGIAECREVEGLLDVRKYREKYPDLDAAFGDDWDAYVNHFLTYGIYERRDSGTNFNALDYADRYADLKEAFGDDVLALYRHYQTYGKNENREARSETVVAAEKQAAEDAARAEETAQGPYTKTWTFRAYTVVGEYDSNDYLLKESYYEDGALAHYNIYEYDSAGNMAKSTLYNADGSVSSWSEYEYDSARNMVKRTHYNADGTIDAWETNEYNSAGILVKNTYQSADSYYGWVNEYDDAGNLIKVRQYYPEGGWTEWEYDSAGNLVKVTDHNADDSVIS